MTPSNCLEMSTHVCASVRHMDAPVSRRHGLDPRAGVLSPGAETSHAPGIAPHRTVLVHSLWFNGTDGEDVQECSQLASILGWTRVPVAMSLRHRAEAPGGPEKPQLPLGRTRQHVVWRLGNETDDDGAS